MTLEYKGSRVYYTDSGKGNPVVLLHGFLENINMWDAFVPELAKKNRLICIDLPGHGKTECLGYVHTMELMAEFVEAVLKKLNITQVTLIGHSMGGYVALAFAKKNAKSVTGLCLMNSTASADSLERKENRNRAILAVKKNHETFIRIAISNLFIPKNRTVFSEKIKKIIEDALKTPLQGVIAALEGMKIRPDSLSFFLNLNCKKTLILGEKDPVLMYNELIHPYKNSNTKIITFPDGHMSHIENKEALLKALKNFLLLIN